MTAIALKFAVVIPAFVLALTLLLGAQVTSLDITIPFSDITLPLQSAVELFANQLAFLISFMPWLETPFDLVVAGFQIKIFLLGLDLIWKFIGMLTSS